MGRYEGRQFEPMALEQGHREASEKKCRRWSVTHFLLVGGQQRLFPLALEKKGRAGTESMRRVLIE